MFGIQQIVLSTAVGAIVSFVVLYLDARYWHRAAFDIRGGLVLSYSSAFRSCSSDSAQMFNNSTMIRSRWPAPTICSAPS